MVEDKSLPSAWRGADVFAAQSKMAPPATAYGHTLPLGLAPSAARPGGLLRGPPQAPTAHAALGMIAGLEMYQQQQQQQQYQQQHQHQPQQHTHQHQPQQQQVRVARLLL